MGLYYGNIDNVMVRNVSVSGDYYKKDGVDHALVTDIGDGSIFESPLSKLMIYKTKDDTLLLFVNDDVKS